MKCRCSQTVTVRLLQITIRCSICVGHGNAAQRMTHYISLTLLTDYPEEPQQYWERSRCCCQHGQQHHSPQSETEAERTEADGADLVENIPVDVTGGGEAEEDENQSTDGATESAFTAGSEEDVGTEGDLGVNESENIRERKEGGRKIDLGVPEEDLAGVLKELELTLKMTTMMEQEKMEDLTRPVETEAACNTVRRRNKRRRAKKDLH